MGLWTGERECGLGLTGTGKWECRLKLGNATADCGPGLCTGTGEWDWELGQGNRTVEWGIGLGN